MHHRILFVADHLVLEYDALANYLHAIWGREQTLETIQAGYEQILLTLQREHCHRLLDNHGAIHGIWTDSADWLSQNWYPRARRAGLEAHTVVFATEFFGRRSTEEVLRRIAGGVIVGFEDVEVARRALLAF
ncbi:hypothetical protein H8B13_07290 [Hymenobacter sp. BT188]|uniref:hypothetical protein n=1 Tax=Hymenobacter sp. BT188 TaxID=2763504 RepID=UPI001651449F|nr:hypothetical protein [Hymenobacter sp. BT188]MBC6606617.1 hypothetical protein [Hymenobacter sp. BT188]